jgi:spore maturation protein CgeB
MELEVRMNEVRYKLGDAFVRAATPSIDTLLLPWRVIKLFFEGVRKARARRTVGLSDRAGEGRAPAEAQPAVDAKPAPAPRVRTMPAWLNDLQPIPELAGSFTPARAEWVRRPALKVAAVVDEFSWRAWQFEADLYSFTPENWRRTLEAKPPDLLLVESTWHGIDDAWHYQLRDLGKFTAKVSHYCMPDVVAWCRSKGIPTVFYNKEDPPNFEFFIDSAKLFDFVFTSDANCIPEYRARLEHRRVFALPFAAQPRIHNPISTGERRGNVCFAGTWYNHRHESRQEAAEAILHPAIDFDLVIFDRMAASESKNYRWPEVFQKHVYAALPYDKMVAAYKRFKLFLNINSVADSPTMFARRVFELLACGTPVVSSRSKGIERFFGKKLVNMSDEEAETRQILSRLLFDDEYRERLALLGQRSVFSEHTYGHRLEKILTSIGKDVAASPGPTFDVIACIRSESEVEPAINNFLRQEYPRKRLLLCANDAEHEPFARRMAARNESITFVGRPDAGWSQTIGVALEACQAECIAVMNPSDYYGPHYLTDYSNATMYVTDTAIGKSRLREVQSDGGLATSLGGRDYHFVEIVCPWTLCLPLADARRMAHQITDAVSPFKWCERAVAACGRIYSSDSFNYVRRDQPAVVVEAEDRRAIIEQQESVQLSGAIV